MAVFNIKLLVYQRVRLQVVLHSFAKFIYVRLHLI
jgi:hypothetical protein